MMNNSNLNSTNVMIDIETLGLTPGSSILSIGAVYFTTNDKYSDSRFYSPIPSLYITIDRFSCSVLGLTQEVSTLLWWDEQSAEVKAEAFRGEFNIITALYSLLNYLMP